MACHHGLLMPAAVCATPNSPVTEAAAAAEAEAVMAATAVMEAAGVTPA
jgi:hypothetical protein